MDDTRKLALINEVLTTHNAHHEDPDGDKFLSDTALCIEVIDLIASLETGPLERDADVITRLVREGWIAGELTGDRT